MVFVRCSTFTYSPMTSSLNTYYCSKCPCCRCLRLPHPVRCSSRRSNVRSCRRGRGNHSFTIQHRRQYFNVQRRLHIDYLKPKTDSGDDERCCTLDAPVNFIAHDLRRQPCDDVAWVIVGAVDVALDDDGPSESDFFSFLRDAYLR